MEGRCRSSAGPGALAVPAHLTKVMLLICMISSALNANLPPIPEPVSPFIVGGDDADISDFAELVSIQVGYGKTQHLCGGIIIDVRWLLTAAHCLDQVDPAAVYILAGATDLSNPGTLAVKVPIAGYEIHEDFSVEGNSLTHDIALINLAEPLPLNNNIQVGSLQNVPPSDGDLVGVAGWGQIDNTNTPKSSSRLQATKLNIMGKEKCQAALQGHATVLDDEICAMSTEGVHAECRGDSGGGLYGDGLVVGLVSWSKKPCGSYPGLFTSIPAHYAWIREKSGLENL